MAETDLILAAKTTAAEPVRVDGEVGPLTTNLDGRLRVSSRASFFETISGALTTLGNTLVADVTDASNLVLHIKNTGTVAMAAGAFVFEGSVDSTNGSNGTWFTVQAVRSDSNTVESGRTASSIAAGSGSTYAWSLSVNAVRWFRIRCSTSVTASSIGFWTIIRGTYATEPVPAVRTHPVTGSGTFTVAGNVTVVGSVTNTPIAGSNFRVVSAASLNASVIKNSPGNLMELSVINWGTALIFVKFYDKITNPVPASDPQQLAFTVAGDGGEKVIEFGAFGKRFPTGIAIAITGGTGAADVTNAPVGAIVTGTYY